MKFSSLAAGNPAAQSLLSAIPDALLDGCRPVHFPAGSAVVRRDDCITSAYFLLSGEFTTFSETVDGKLSSFLVMPAPDIVSDLEVLAQREVYATSVFSTADSMALRCPISDFRTAIDQSYAFLREVSGRFARKSFRFSYHQGGAAFRPGIEKVALCLINECALHPPCPGQSVTIPRTRSAISSSAVVSLKTVDRSIYTLRDRGYLTLPHGKVCISHSQYARLLADWWTSDIPPVQSIWPKG